MITKLLVSDNLVTSLGAHRRRGVALISVVAMLVLLALIATPFLITQRDSAARGERFLYNDRAEAEADSLFQLVRAELVRSVEHVERAALDELGPGAGAAGGERPPIDATPNSDVLEEFSLSPDLLARFNRMTAREHRVWHVEVIDQQSLANLNNCSIPLLGNILGHSSLAENVGGDDDVIPVADPSIFPQRHRYSRFAALQARRRATAAGGPPARGLLHRVNRCPRRRREGGCGGGQVQPDHRRKLPQ